MTDNFEHENNDEFVEADAGLPEESAPPSKGVVGKISTAWQTSPLLKFMALATGVFAVGAAAVNFFSTEEAPGTSARLKKPPSLKEAPGGAASPYLRQQTEMANDERAQEAIATGGSAIPTPLGQGADQNNSKLLGRRTDPLKELRAETDQLKRQMQKQEDRRNVQARAEQFDDSLARAMQKQMEQLMEGWAPRGIKNVTVIDASKIQARTEKEESTQKAEVAKVIVPAGTVSYAQLLTEANSDVPGPILAQIVSGPLAGARAVGAFQVADGYEKYLVLKFTLADKKGKDYTINAVALDPDTTLGGMATEVDERYLARVILPAAAGFLQGLGEAMSQGNTSITTSGSTTIVTRANEGFREGMYQGLGDAANTVGQFFRQQANQTKPLIRVAAGTPMGLFFVSSVTDGKQGENVLATQQQAANRGGYPPSSRFIPGVTDASVANSVPYPTYATPSSGYTGYSTGYTGGYPGYSRGPYYQTMPSPYIQQNYGQ